MIILFLVTHPSPTDVHKKYFEVQVAEFIELYIAGFLLFIGVFGNGMTLVILARKRMLQRCRCTCRLRLLVTW